MNDTICDFTRNFVQKWKETEGKNKNIKRQKRMRGLFPDSLESSKVLLVFCSTKNFLLLILNQHVFFPFSCKFLEGKWMRYLRLFVKNITPYIVDRGLHCPSWKTEYWSNLSSLIRNVKNQLLEFQGVQSEKEFSLNFKGT